MKYKALYQKRKLITTAAAFALAPLTEAAETEIEWISPDEYADLGTDFHDEVTLEQFQEELEPYIARIASKTLPDGFQLEIRVTNVDLAGEYEPWRLNNDVRIVRSIYPPMMSFEYKLYDARGELVRSGEENLVDPTFDFNIGRRFFQTDGFFYEKELIASWIRNDLANSLDS